MTRFQTGELGHLVRASTVVKCIKKKEINIQLSKKKKKGIVALIFFTTSKRSSPMLYVLFATVSTLQINFEGPFSLP